jgi:hypothetical protein
VAKPPLAWGTQRAAGSGRREASHEASTLLWRVALDRGKTRVSRALPGLFCRNRIDWEPGKGLDADDSSGRGAWRGASGRGVSPGRCLDRKGWALCQSSRSELPLLSPTVGGRPAVLWTLSVTPVPWACAAALRLCPCPPERKAPVPCSAWWAWLGGMRACSPPPACELLGLGSLADPRVREDGQVFVSHELPSLAPWQHSNNFGLNLPGLGLPSFMAGLQLPGT